MHSPLAREACRHFQTIGVKKQCHGPPIAQAVANRGCERFHRIVSLL